MSKRFLMPACSMVCVALFAGCIDGNELAVALEPGCAGATYPLVSDVNLPQVNRAAEPAPAADLLSLTRSSVDLNGARVIETAALVDSAPLLEALKAAHDRIEVIGAYRGEDPTRRILLAADANLPTATMNTALVAIASAGFSEIIVLGAPRTQPPLPRLPDPALAARLRSGDDHPSIVATRIAEAVESAIWFCPDLTTIFSVVATADPSQKCALMVAGFRETSRLCFGDQDALVTLLHLLVAPRRYTTFRAFELAPEFPMGNAPTWGSLLAEMGESATKLGLQRGVPAIVSGP